MERFYITLALAVTLSISSVSAQVSATEIYHWVDENGVSHFSQRPPDKETQNVSTKRIVDNAPGDGAESEDIYNTKEHAERMAAWRKERDQQRKDARERKELAAKQQQKYQQPESYGPTYWRRPIYARPPLRPTPTPLPERPIFNPRPPVASLHGDG